MPLCARCLGIILGFSLSPAAFDLNVAGSVGVMVPMIVDGFTQFLGLRQSKDGLRLLTGCGFGVGIGTLLFQL